MICAANGIGTPRLLLLSADPRFPDGLANSSGLVGRRLMMHPHQRAIGLFDDSLGTWQGQNGAYLVCLEFHETDTRRGFVRGAKWTLAPTGGPLGLALGADVWGADHHRHLAERLGRTVGWNVMVEDLPDQANRVDLSERAVDSSGLAAPRLTYRVDDNAERILAWNVARATESLLEAGARRVEYTRAPLNGHFMGTARMGDDPATSVVDRWGLAHDVPNLAVVDGSLFVTAGSTNPTATICALALRTAQHLVERRRDLPVPRRRARPVAAGYAPHHRPRVTGSLSTARPLDLTADQWGRLARLADALIPGDGPMPPAGSVVGRLLGAVTAARPDLIDPLQAVLAVEFSSAPDRLAQLRPEPTQWAALVTTVAGAYYLAPEVHAGLDYPGLVALPVVVEFPAYVAEGLLERVAEPSAHH